MNRGLGFIGAVGLGAGLMYVLDPDRGKRRRARIRDKAIHAFKRAECALDATSRDIRNRAQGLFAEARSLMGSEEVSDEVLVERIRSKMGRVVSHPHAIQVSVNKGRATLSGPILRDEVADLLACVLSMSGIADVEDQLKVHESAGTEPALQGGSRRPGVSFELMQENWSPAARLLVGANGACLIVWGSQTGGIPGTAGAILGTGMFLRAVTNASLKRIVGLEGRRAVDFQKTIHINAPVEKVFEFWNNLENFPGFMRNVLEVRRIDERRCHWKVAGPGGVPVEFDTEITKLVPDQLLAWKSVEGSLVKHAGIVRFGEENGGSRVEIKMTYNPPAGVIGHAVATLFGSNPRQEMDEDLVRMKSIIETGKAPHDAAQKGTAAREATVRSR